MRGYIAQTYGKDHLPETPNVYKTKAKAAQEAHEAVRPTDAGVDAGARARPFFDAMGERDMYRLYELDLEPVRRLPDGAGGLRPDHRRHRRGARHASAPPGRS